METLSNVLYWLSTGLFVPVMLGTVIMFIYSIILSGVFYGNYKDYLNYRKFHRNNISNHEFLIEMGKNRKTAQGELIPFINELYRNRWSKAESDRVLSEFELYADKTLGKYKTLAKLGPILGLMGTLIPMGPALAGLGQGDVSSMSWNMQVAFSTTVIGLFAGTLGFLMLQPRHRILVSYLADLEYLAEYISENRVKDNGKEEMNVLVTGKIIQK